MKRVLPFFVGLAGVVAIAALTWRSMAIVGDGFWTIATGRWLLAHRALPTGDPFAFGSTGEWSIVSSGACVVFAGIVDAFGLRGLEAFATLVEAGAVAAVWVRARTSLARAALLPLALFYVFVDAEDLSARGQVFGDLALVLLLGVIARVRDGKRLSPGHLALYAVFVAAWTNLHLSFLAAVFVPLVGAGASLLESRKLWRPYVLLAVVAAVATCVNPYGPAYLRLALGTAFDSSTTTLDLFRSPDFHDLPWLVAPAVAIALLVVLGRRGSVAEAAFLLFFLAAACKSRRFATALTAVEIGLAGPILDELWRSRSRPRLLLVTASVTLGFGVYSFATEGWMAKDPLRDVPAQGALVARAGHDVATPLHWGGYLAYAWMGKPRYFIDGRDHLVLFGNGAFDDATMLWNGAPNSFEILDAYDVDVVLWERGSVLDAMLAQNPRWRREMAGPIEVVYVRAPSPGR